MRRKYPRPAHRPEGGSTRDMQRNTALPSGRIGLMPKHLSAEDIFPLVDCLSPDERLRLLRFITVRPAADDQDMYRSLSPRNGEFSSDEDLLAWDAEGWEGVR